MYTHAYFGSLSLYLYIHVHKHIYIYMITILTIALIYHCMQPFAKLITCQESVPPCDSAGPRWCPVLWLSRPAALRCDRGISAPDLAGCP